MSKLKINECLDGLYKLWDIEPDTYLGLEIEYYENLKSTFS